MYIRKIFTALCFNEPSLGTKYYKTYKYYKTIFLIFLLKFMKCIIHTYKYIILKDLLHVMKVKINIDVNCTYVCIYNICTYLYIKICIYNTLYVHT